MIPAPTVASIPATRKGAKRLGKGVYLNRETAAQRDRRRWPSPECAENEAAPEIP